MCVFGGVVRVCGRGRGRAEAVVARAAPPQRAIERARLPALHRAVAHAALLLTRLLDLERIVMS